MILGTGETDMEKKNHTGKEKDKEKQILSAAEKKRLEQFEKTAAQRVQQGYTRHDLTIDIGKANVFAIVLIFPLLIIGYGLYYLIYRNFRFSDFNLPVFAVSFIALIVVHELIHGVSWSFFTPHHFKDVEFGIMRPSMTPYCACLRPLKKGSYIFGAVMPLVLLGIIPMIVGIAIKNTNVLLLGIVMADAAAGDIMIVWRILCYKTSAKEVVYMDHPTQAGGVIFEK